MAPDHAMVGAKRGREEDSRVGVRVYGGAIAGANIDATSEKSTPSQICQFILYISSSKG